MKNSLLAVIIFTCIGITSFSAQNQTNESVEISNLIRKKREFNKENGASFRIQLYNGNEERATFIKEKFEEEFPEILTKLVFDNPDWKVHVGNYKTKLEADKAKLLFRKFFTGIIVVPLSK